MDELAALAVKDDDDHSRDDDVDEEEEDDDFDPAPNRLAFRNRFSTYGGCGCRVFASQDQRLSSHLFANPTPPFAPPGGPARAYWVQRCCLMGMWGAGMPGGGSGAEHGFRLARIQWCCWSWIAPKRRCAPSCVDSDS